MLDGRNFTAVRSAAVSAFVLVILGANETPAATFATLRQETLVPLRNFAIVAAAPPLHHGRTPTTGRQARPASIAAMTIAAITAPATAIATTAVIALAWSSAMRESPRARAAHSANQATLEIPTYKTGVETWHSQSGVPF